MSSEASNLWRECVQYLIRCGILDQNHKVNWPSSDILDFAQILRDGVLLCQLSNRLSKGCIDMREISLRPQLSQFLCLKNICLFLGACQTTFNIPQKELFEAWQLYKVSDFGKILQTISKLSKTEVALHSGISGFPQSSNEEEVGPGHEYYNDDIYRTLAEEAESKELEEDLYDAGSDIEEYGKIYDCIVMQRHRHPEEFIPKDKREHCIKELLDTEKNYVEALNMLLQKFYTPLREVLSPDDYGVIFMNMQELAQIHTAFHSEIGKAVRHTVQGIQSDSPGGSTQRIGDVFVRWKPKFVAYSEYCSKLPKAQNRIERLSQESSSVRQKIVECQADANQNRFRLQDLLSVPMQRVLKYHLLLKELAKSTPAGHEDKPSLDAALDAMLDLSLYINEVKRDCETLQIIKDIQNSIIDLNMPENTDLSDYGRLLKDGELRLCSHQDRSKVKNRYVFVFDKVLMICKNIKANQYEYKHAVVLSEYQIEEPEAENNNRGFGTLIKGGPKWSYSWLLVHSEGRNVFQLYTKSQEQKTAWISAINMAHDNVHPFGTRPSDHKYQFCSMDDATECSQCGKLLRGLIYQGYKCANCGLSVHKECIVGSSGCGRPHPPPRKTMSFSTGSNLVGQQFRAVKAFRGNNGGPDFLCFNENDAIEVISVDTGIQGWWRGRILEGQNQDRQGLFPADYVRKHNRISSGIHSPRRWDTWHGGPAGRGSLELDSPLIQTPSTPFVNSRTISNASTVSVNSVMIVNGGGAGPLSPAPPTPRKSGYINLEEVENHSWFCGALDRDMSEYRLMGLPNGTYLVRYSEKQGRYAISISFDGEVKHVKVEQGPDGYWLDESQSFRSIVELITYYSEHNLQESFQALNTNLKQSLRSCIQSYAVAMHNFEASAPNMISLRKGDQVMVLSKNGNERGWWKGKINGRVGYFPLAYVTEVETNSPPPPT